MCRCICTCYLEGNPNNSLKLCPSPSLVHAHLPKKHWHMSGGLKLCFFRAPQCPFGAHWAKHPFPGAVTDGYSARKSQLFSTGAARSTLWQLQLKTRNVSRRRTKYTWQAQVLKLHISTTRAARDAHSGSSSPTVATLQYERSTQSSL